MTITGPSNSTPPVPPPVTIDQVCDALDAAGFDALDNFPPGVSMERGTYLLVRERSLWVVSFAGGRYHIDVDEDGCACLSGIGTIDNLDELQRLVTAWSESFDVGDLVVVMDASGPMTISKVIDIQEHIHGPRVVLADGSMWDVRYHRVRQWTPGLQAQLVDRQRRSAVEWAGEQWDKLTPEQRELIGDAARAVRRATT